MPVLKEFPTELPITYSTDLGRQPTDSFLWEYARRHELAILTKNADFGNRIQLSEPPPWVVHLRIGNMRRRSFLDWINQTWPTLESLLPENKLINVYQDRLELVGS